MIMSDEELPETKPRPALQLVERLIAVAAQAFGYGFALAWTQFAGKHLEKKQIKRRKNRAELKD